VVTTFCAISSMSIAFLGYFGGSLGLIGRIVMLLAGVMFIPPSPLINLAGYAVFFGILWRERIYPYIGMRSASGKEE